MHCLTRGPPQWAAKQNQSSTTFHSFLDPSQLVVCPGPSSQYRCCLIPFGKLEFCISFLNHICKPKPLKHHHLKAWLGLSKYHFLPRQNKKIHNVYYTRLNYETHNRQILLSVGVAFMLWGVPLTQMKIHKSMNKSNKASPASDYVVSVLKCCRLVPIRLVDVFSC